MCNDERGRREKAKEPCHRHAFSCVEMVSADQTERQLPFDAGDGTMNLSPMLMAVIAVFVFGFGQVMPLLLLGSDAGLMPRCCAAEAELRG